MKLEVYRGANIRCFFSHIAMFDNPPSPRWWSLWHSNTDRSIPEHIKLHFQIRLYSLDKWSKSDSIRKKAIKLKQRPFSSVRCWQLCQRSTGYWIILRDLFYPLIYRFGFVLVPGCFGYNTNVECLEIWYWGASSFVPFIQDYVGYRFFFSVSLRVWALFW